MLLILTGVTLLFSYWALEGVMFHKIFDVDKIVFKTDKEVYQNGETVRGTFSFCKNLEVDPVVQWSLIDTYLRTYPPRAIHSPYKGCVKDQITDIEIIAPNLPPDSYYFSGTATYKLNPIKTIVVPLITNKFEVK